MSRSLAALRILLVAAGALLVLLPLVAWRDYVSLERGNRLYRAGRFAGAVRLYRRHARPDSSQGAVTYNLGTAWLGLGSQAEAESNLEKARVAEDPEVRYRAHFNFGYLLYTEGLKLRDRSMSAQLVGEAVLAFRDALRVRPESDDARWNLALAMQALDSLTVRDMAVLRGIPTRAEPVGLEAIGEWDASGGQGDRAELSAKEGGEALMSPDQRRRLGGGAQEALAQSGEPELRTPGEIALVLAAINDDVSALLRRLLWLGGPRGGLSGQVRHGGEW